MSQGSQVWCVCGCACRQYVTSACNMQQKAPGLLLSSLLVCSRWRALKRMHGLQSLQRSQLQGSADLRKCIQNDTVPLLRVLSILKPQMAPESMFTCFCQATCIV